MQSSTKSSAFQTAVLLPYQQRWITDDSKIKVWSKARRIGASWIEACASVLAACAAVNGRSSIYLGYNREMTRGFIKDCEFWVKSFNIVSSDVHEYLVDNEDKDILSYEIRFPNGHTIKALSGKPNNIRSRQARVIIDEAAFCDNLPDLLKAAIALLMWGGSVAIISTHNGIDNPFNQLIEQIKAGDLSYSLHTTTLDDALADGLYQRICLVQGKKWTPLVQEEWRSQLYRDYGVAAAEELDCKPFDPVAGRVFNRSWFEVVDKVPSGGITVRFFDLAATAADVKKDAFYTAGVKMKKVDGIYYVLDLIAEQLSPAEADKLIVSTAQQDSKNVRLRWEMEGGSAGKRDEVHLRSLLAGFDARATKPLGDKVIRAKPYASEAMRGNVKLLRGEWNDRYLNSLHAFDGTPKPLVNDIADSSSGAFAELSKAPARVNTRAISYTTWGG